MFEPCPLTTRAMCGFAAIANGEMHCGIISSSFEGTKVKNLPKCTKEMSKYEQNKHAKQLWNTFKK